MDVDQAQQIRASAELSVGDEIEAWHNGRLFHRGRVTQTVAAMDLFWIVDVRTGARRLLDVDVLEILRVRAAQTAAPRPPALPPAGLHTVLFHAPDLRNAGQASAG